MPPWVLHAPMVCYKLPVDNLVYVVPNCPVLFSHGLHVVSQTYTLTKQNVCVSYWIITAWNIIFQLAASYLNPTDAMRIFPFLKQPFCIHVFQLLLCSVTENSYSRPSETLSRIGKNVKNVTPLGVQEASRKSRCR